ncbi:thiamine phosphate synthase [Alteromonas sp. C1M14]|uniref:thiamine phosphate synthase n=1 Tax=Alteromonas sp. C1M14 TaxID=2841567 RepID=UPI001C09E1A1|nr:thiamine phosphate synthase [Alteromonas sp. C1M14]MBU2979954.1 thiamine phosphate synthase [Alteromonas sp. C1M14]
MKTVLMIGGIDSSGGAGIAQDVRANNDGQLHTATVCTLVSAQSHSGTQGVTAVPQALFRQQLECAFSGAGLRAIKIGALANDEQAAMIVKHLRLYPNVPVVWDPIQKSSSGGVLGALSFDSICALLVHTTLLTPNLHELSALTGMPVNSAKQQWQAAHNLLGFGCQQVLVKGGHRDNNSQVFDTLYQHETCWHYVHQHRQPFSLRGSGCLLASAVAGALACDYPVEDAVCIAEAKIAGAYGVAQKIDQHKAVTSYVPCPPALSDYPAVYRGFFAANPALNFARLRYASPGLYPVVNSIEWLARLLPLGVRIIQLRIKTTASTVQRELSRTIKQAVALCARYSTQLFINDHWQLAIEHGAFGVHLGQEDLSQANTEHIARAGLRLGVSTHGYAELCRAITLKPSYIALGHVYPTRTKTMPSLPQGPNRLKAYAALCGDIPTVAIGGINSSNLDEVLACKVNSVAVVTAITESATPEATTMALQKRINHATC